MNNNLPESHCTQKRKQMHQESIVITKCLTSGCTGFYTDSIDETIFVICSDPKHHIDDAGHQPTSDADNALLKTTTTQPTKLGSVIKWNIQESQIRRFLGQGRSVSVS
jgi:hypothetical protein